MAAGEIGAPANSKIVIDFSDKINCLQQELQQLSEKKSEKEELKEKIELMLIKLKTREATPELEGHCKKTTNTINHLAGELQEIEENELAIETEIEAIRKGVCADVYGRIYPGVEFIICHESYRTRNEVPTCVVRFRNRQMLYDGAQGEFVG